MMKTSCSFNFEEYKQKSLDFANNIDKWYSQVKNKKNSIFENDDDFIYIETSPSWFTSVFEESKENCYENLNYESLSDNSFTSESDEDVSYKII